MAKTNEIGKHKTTVTTENGVTKVKYHNTVVVEFDKHGILLNSGGYRTNTTKLRMNQTSQQFGLGFSVYQRKGEWYISMYDTELSFYDNIRLIKV